VLKKKQVSASNYLFDGNNKYKLLDAVDVKASGPVPHTILVAPGGKVLYRKSGSCEPMAFNVAISASCCVRRRARRSQLGHASGSFIGREDTHP
jgi:hypothetical protein